jgi:hypothetical protein
MPTLTAASQQSRAGGGAVHRATTGPRRNQCLRPSDCATIETMDTALTQTISLLGVAILVAIIARLMHLPYTIGLVLTGIGLAIVGLETGTMLTHDFMATDGRSSFWYFGRRSHFAQQRSLRRRHHRGIAQQHVGDWTGGRLNRFGFYTSCSLWCPPAA